MLRRRWRKLLRMTAMAPALGGALVGLTACGGSSGGGAGGHATKATTGRAIFQSAGCAGCHTLRAAGATGDVGPNLDSLQPSAATVRFQVEHGGGVMPSFTGTLTAAQINAVANFVASSAGH